MLHASFPLLCKLFFLEQQPQPSPSWLAQHLAFLRFVEYHGPNRMHFVVLRVLNDDPVSPDAGFGRHPHDNMEIISIPPEGELGIPTAWATGR